jgi:uncharacterized membrane protein HdeD (DUF308 family)
VFYGAGAVIIRYLLYQSEFVPKFLGILWLLGGLGQMVNAFAVVVAPSIAAFWQMLPLLVALMALALWFLVRGVDAGKWRECAARRTFL